MHEPMMSFTEKDRLLPLITVEGHGAANENICPHRRRFLHTVLENTTSRKIAANRIDDCHIDSPPGRQASPVVQDTSRQTQEAADGYVRDGVEPRKKSRHPKTDDGRPDRSGPERGHGAEHCLQHF